LHAVCVEHTRLVRAGRATAPGAWRSNARDSRFEATPLAFATIGNGEQDGSPGDWITTVRLLLDADADRQDLWVTDKPLAR
jgi:hypothetical protein